MSERLVHALGRGQRVRGRWKRGGLTLIESLVAIAIVSILATVANSSYEQYLYRARVAQAANDMLAISHKLIEFRVENRVLPASLAEVGMASLRDPWGRPYVYTNLSSQKGAGSARKRKNLAPLNSDFDLYSVGKDGVSATSLMAKASRDDVVRALDGRFMGLASSLDP